MLKETKRPEIEEDLIVLLENDKVKYYTEGLSFQIDELLRRIPALMDGPVCPLDDGVRCECTYETGCRAKNGGIALLQEPTTQNNVVDTGAYKILDLD
jgi:hypothetical protein